MLMLQCGHCRMMSLLDNWGRMSNSETPRNTFMTCDTADGVRAAGAEQGWIWTMQC